MRVLRKAFENWEQQVLRPVVTSLLTAAILFTVSLVFKPVRSFLFPGEVRQYPLHCTAEPYLDAAREFLLVDFFIINRTGDEHTREDLNTFLQTHNQNPDARLSPDIVLKYNRLLDGRPLGRFEHVIANDEFNRDKGDLAISVTDRQVSITINRIARWAVMKLRIEVGGIPDIPTLTVLRMAKGQVPFEFEQYQDGCYSRP